MKFTAQFNLSMKIRPFIVHLVRMMPLLLTLASVAHAKLDFEITTQTLPTKWSDAKVEAVYKFKNTGNETVKITDMQSSCGCTVPMLEKKVYAPGESGELKTVFTPGDKIGPQVKTITLKTDLKDQPTIELTFKTDVPALPGFEPQLIYWNRGDKPDPKSIAVTLPPDVPLDKIEITPKDSDFTVTLKTVEEGKSYEIVVTPPKNLVRVVRVVIPVVIHLKDGTTRTRTASAMVR